MQLDLFNSARKLGEIVVFPTDRRAVLVRQTAGILRSKKYHQARSYWNRHVANLRKELAGTGIPVAQIQQEIDCYTRAVSRELNLHRITRAQPDGAA
jgi:hypothetical protein